MSSFTQQPSNIGSKLLIAKQQANHQKRLQQIYTRPARHQASTPALRKYSNGSRLSRHEDYEHHQNIRHLFGFISRKKNMADRLKDPHDFFAYPVYFFREEKSKPAKIKKKSRKTVNSYDDLSEQSEFTRRYGLDVPMVKQMLPTLHQFSQRELQDYVDGIARIIHNFNLKSKEQILHLKRCVLRTLDYLGQEDLARLESLLDEAVFRL